MFGRLLVPKTVTTQKVIVQILNINRSEKFQEVCVVSIIACSLRKEYIIITNDIIIIISSSSSSMALHLCTCESY
jgi:hypothetical protein